MAIVHRLWKNPKADYWQTACGIKFVAVFKDNSGRAYGRNNGLVKVTERGEPFDCKRCKIVLEAHTGKSYKGG